MTEPLGDAFWQAEAERLIDVMRPWVEEAAKKGAAEGLTALGDIALDLVIDWDLINDYARAWAVAHTAEVVASVTTTSMKAFTDAFPNWVASGKPLRELTRELSKSYEPWRAKMIAVTETTRAYSRGNHVMWGASGVVDGTKWMTGVDEMVCPLCGGMAGEEAPMDGTYKDGSYGPPKHVACRCYEKPVVKSKVTGESEVPTVGDSRVSAEVQNSPEWRQIQSTRDNFSLTTNEQARKSLNTKYFKEATAKPFPGSVATTWKNADEANAWFAKEFNDVYGSRPLMVRTSDKSVEAILRSGRIKTQFETGVSGGINSTKGRVTAERLGLGLADDTDDVLRPIYGLLDDIDGIGAKNSAQYGNVRWIMKDEVKDRCTVTFNDSLSPFLNKTTAGTPLRAPELASLNGPKHLSAISVNERLPQIVKGGYMEVQIQAGVTMDDIASVVVESSSMSKEKLNELLALFDEFGIPVEVK